MGTLADLTARLGFKIDHSPLEKLEHKLDGIKERLEFLGAAEVVRGLFELGEKFSGMGEQLETAAVSAGITTEAFQRLSFAASQNAVGQEEMTGALARLNRAVFEAKNGAKEQAAAFANIGITPEQLAGFHNSSEALSAMADRFKAIKDPMLKQAAAMQLLGRGSFQMVKLLNQGSEGISDFGDEADRLGVVLGHHAVEKLAKLEDSLSGLFMVVRSVGSEIAAMLAPEIMTGVKAVEKFIEANRSMLMVRIKKWLGNFAFALGFLYGAFRTLTQALLDFVARHPQLTAAAGNITIALLALSLVLGGVLKIMNVVKGTFGPLIGLLGGLKKAFIGSGEASGWATNFILGGFSLVRGGLLRLMLLLGRLLSGIFPGLAAWLFRIATAMAMSPIGLWTAAFIAAVSAIYLVIKGVQALWDVMHGKSFAETDLGKMVEKIKGVPGSLKGMWKALTGQNDEDADADKESHKFPVPYAPDDSLQEQGDGDQVRLPPQMASFVPKGMEGLQAQLSSMQSPEVSLAPQGIEDAGGAQSISYNINAPVSISVPPSMASEQAQKAVTDGIAKHLDSVKRDAMRKMRTAKAY